MDKIVLASSNKGKIQELQFLLKPLQHIGIIPQDELNVSEIAETGLTFVENALLKARHASQQTGLPAIADDSGLVVPALQGAPGIFSARYAGDQANSTDNINKLLSELAHHDRTAAFHCVLVFMLHEKDPTPLICHGTWSGQILKTPRGKKGFGYDPIFFDPVEDCSAAELSIERKNQISHRGKALQKLLELLPSKWIEKE